MQITFVNWQLTKIALNRLKDTYDMVSAQLCSAQTLAQSPALRRREPQNNTYSYHGNKCLKGNARSVTKVTLEGQDKSQRDIKDT